MIPETATQTAERVGLEHQEMRKVVKDLQEQVERLQGEVQDLQDRVRDVESGPRHYH